MALSNVETEEFHRSEDLIPDQSSDENLVIGETSDGSFKNLPRHLLSRLVSQEELGVERVKDYTLQFPSLSGCETHSSPATGGAALSVVPPFPNSLNDAGILKSHISALRLEADLHPLRLALSRLMGHPTYNRRGMFNHPVDPVALGLPDYHLVVTHPMDLGSIKSRLHALAYLSRRQAVEDIRLVFSNAMRYNPPHNTVHICAKELLAYFESYLEGLGPCVSTTASDAAESQAKYLHATTSSRQVVEATFKSPVESRTCAEVYSTPVPIAGVPSTRYLTSEIAHSATAGGASTGLSPPILERASPAWQVPSSSLSKPRVRMPRKRASTSNFHNGISHACAQCQGRTCLICRQGCLQHEPALLVCCGAHCGGARIRKGALYYITKDGTHQFCERCYTGLPSILLHSVQNEAYRYKQELLKRKNDEEIAEDWITCSDCSGGVHSVCAMHNGYVHDTSKYACPDCASISTVHPLSTDNDSKCTRINLMNETMYTFVSGSVDPVPIASIKATSSPNLNSESLKESPISAFIQEKVQKVMKNTRHAEKTINVRVISDCYRQFSVPDVVQRYFRCATYSKDVVPPPSSVQYRQKAITMFQKIDGLDVCIFCMYVQEYDGESSVDGTPNKRVYIAYIDSVEHFRPRQLRTQVFHEILIAYLATARERGFQTAQIWACPPSRGNCFVFWNHPASQRTPTKERLLAWYHGALSKAVDFGVVTDVKSLFESDFEKPLSELTLSSEPAKAGVTLCERMVCPPLVEGDLWIEEAVRIHNSNLARYLKVGTLAEVCVWNVPTLANITLDASPAMQVAALLKDRIMAHPASVPFRRPVNAAALKLKDYHKIVKKPIDLGTIYSRCILGDYNCLQDVVKDVELMVSNAKLYNPPGNFVYRQADEVLDLFFMALTPLIESWRNEKTEAIAYSGVSMSLDAVVDPNGRTPASSFPIVLIEDDRSSDGSRSVASSVATARWSLAANIQISTEESLHSQVSPSVDTHLKTSIKAKKHRGRSKAMKEPFKRLDILSDGPEAIVQRMVGDDLWLLDKRNPGPPKKLDTVTGKKRSRNTINFTEEEQPLKKRRQSWLCEEVGASIRNMRASLFSCTLLPTRNMSKAEADKLESYSTYVSSFRCHENSCEASMPSSLADTRSALLELSQFRHFEFDTLRRAKYSTNMLLYHIHYSEAPGTTPTCTTCGEAIAEVRWHKAKKIGEIRKPSSKDTTKVSGEALKKNQTACSSREDLCSACHEKIDLKDNYIPIPAHGRGTEI